MGVGYKITQHFSPNVMRGRRFARHAAPIGLGDCFAFGTGRAHMVAVRPACQRSQTACAKRRNGTISRFDQDRLLFKETAPCDGAEFDWDR
jgi:hypothetical protein